MAQLAAAPGLDSLAGIDARMAAIAKLEKLSEDIEAAESRRKSNGVLRRAIKAWREGDIVRAGQLSLEATQRRRQQRQGLSCAGHGAGAHGPSAQGARHL